MEEADLMDYYVSIKKTELDLQFLQTWKGIQDVLKAKSKCVKGNTELVSGYFGVV